jgi:hypothetical protein
MNGSPSILDVMQHDELFGPYFAGTSWRNWKTFLAALFGLWMRADQRSFYTQCTGRQTVPTQPFGEATLICGRRSGKSRILALVATYLALFRPWQQFLAPGEVATIACICTDRRQARTLIRYVQGLLRATPATAELIVGDNAWSINLPSRRVVIEVHTASFKVTRGYSLAAVLADECAFWPTNEESAETDVEIIRAVRPGLLTLRPAGSMLLLASSPYSRKGVLWDSYKRYYGTDDAPVLVWRASTLTMNSTVDPAEIAKAREEDPESASSEYDALFRQDISSLLDRAVVEAAVIPGRHELPRQSRFSYQAFVDPSGGSSDSMCLGIAHAEDRNGVRVGVLDCLREQRVPFDPDSVCAEFAQVLRDYGLHSCVGDRYGGSWPASRFEAHGIRYEPSEKSKSELYLAAVPLLNAHRVELLDSARLVAQFCSLERRTGRGTGRDSIDSPAHQHDDLCNVAAGVLTAVAGERDFLSIWLACIGKDTSNATFKPFQHN